MSAKGENLYRIALTVVFLVGAVLACCPTPGEGAVTVVIVSPGDGGTVVVGQEVMIDSTVTTAAGVDRVDLLVGGDVVRHDTPPEGNLTTFRVSQLWTPTSEGLARVSVVAYDANEASGEATITLLVASASEGGSDASAVPPTEQGAAVTLAPTQPTETPLPPVTTDTGCTLDSQYVADVTIPDGTVMSPGQAFVKKWQVRNPGTCDWGAGFQLVLVSGAQMGGPASVPLPAVPAGGKTDVSVNLTAPSAYGTHKGTWRMRADDGTMFGANLTVLITVPAPATDTPEPPPATYTAESTELHFTPVVSIVLPIVTPQGPDLIISHFVVTPPVVHLGQEVSVQVRVINVGDVPSGGFNSRWQAPGDECIWRSPTGLDPGEDTTLNCEATITGVGTLPTVATVDISGEVDEVNEDNNTGVFPVTVSNP